MTLPIPGQEKRVDFDNPILGDEITACCDEARGRMLLVIPSVRMVHPPEYGYAIISSSCSCLSRWLPHDWRKVAQGPLTYDNVECVLRGIGYSEGES